MGILTSIGAWVNVVLDPVLSPLLKLGPFWAVIILSFFIALFINIVTKLVTDQTKMKELKTEMKSFQTKMKEAGQDVDKRMKMQKQAMEKNFAYMKHSFKSTFVTIIPLLLVFGWMQLHLGFVPLQAAQPFDVTVQFNDGITGNAVIEAPNLELIPSVANGTAEAEKTKTIVDGKTSWKLQGNPGDYTLSYKVMEKTYNNEISIKSEGDYGYKLPNTVVKDGIVKTIDVGLEKIMVLNLFGWKMGWFWSYVLLSVIFSMGLRKVMGIY